MRSLNECLSFRMDEHKKALDNKTVQCQVLDGTIQELKNISQLVFRESLNGKNDITWMLDICDRLIAETKKQFSDIEAEGKTIFGAIQAIKKFEFACDEYDHGCKKLSEEIEGLSRGNFNRKVLA